MVLPPFVAGIIVLLLVYYGVEWERGHKLPTGWDGLVPKSLASGLLMAFMTAGTLFATHLKAREHPTTANCATAAGFATTVVLSWATPLCDWTGGIAAGVTIAGSIIIVGAVVRALTVRNEWGLTKLRSIQEPNGGIEGLVSAMQIGVAIYMSFVVLISFTSEEIPSPALPLLLAFAGVGLAAAATVGTEHSLKNYMAIAGMIISLVGAYIQIDQAIVATGEGGISARDIMVAAIILAFAPFALFASRKHKIVRNLAIPLLAAVIAMCITTFATLIPAILIASGCSASDNLKFIVVGVISIIAIAAAIATFLVSIMVLMFGKRETPNVDR